MRTHPPTWRGGAHRGLGRNLALQVQICTFRGRMVNGVRRKSLNRQSVCFRGGDSIAK